MSLSISNASPIQFWLTGDESFNQKEVCSIYPTCFCQQIDLTDDLRLDILDPNDGVNYLVKYLDDGTIWGGTSTFAQTFDHHQYCLILGSNGDWNAVSGRKLIFKICNNVPILIAASSWTDISSWSSKTLTTFNKSGGGVGSGSSKSYQPCIVDLGNSVSISITTFSSGSVSLSTSIFLTDDSNAIISNVLSNSGNGTINGTLIPTSNATRLSILAGYNFGAGYSITITLNTAIGSVLVVNEEDILAYSDCIDIIDTDQNCTELITYSNSSPFAGLLFIIPASADILAYTSGPGAVTVSNSSSTIISSGGYTGTKGMSIGFNWTVNVTIFNCVCRLKITVEQLSGFITTDLYTQNFTTTGSISGSLFFFQITHNITNIKYVLEYVSGGGTTTATVTVAVGNWQNPTFNLRIPAVFYDEQYPQEQEDLELSDDTIITLWSKIEGKKLLDIGYMPFYMHKKLQMILMMDSVTIENIDYRLRDPYQITSPASKRSALRRAQVLLSEKDFINRNLL